MMSGRANSSQFFGLIGLFALGMLLVSCGQKATPVVAPEAKETEKSRALSEHEQRLKRAGNGNQFAIVELAGNFRTGTNGAPKDIAQAQYWIRKGLDKGLAGAYNQLALLHSEYQIPDADPNVAKANFLRAHNLGDWNATRNYALQIVRANGLVANSAGERKQSLEALPFFLLCAERGNPKCSSDVAFHYASYGDKDDAPLLLFFAEKAAEGGESYGMRVASDLYYNGIGGIPKNEAAALYWADKCLDKVQSEAFSEKGVRSDGYTTNLNRLRARSAILWASGVEPKRPATSDYQPPKPKETETK